MALRTSPGIYTSELQLTQVAVEVSRTTPCILGGATKGPVNTPTRVASEQQLIRTFGLPVENDLGILSAIEFLKNGNALVFIRVAGTSVATAASNVVGKPVSVPGAYATGTVTLLAQPNDADTVTISDGTTSKIFEFDTAVAATGSIVFTGLPTDGQTVIINDGFVARTFEFDSATAATGSVTIAVGNAADGDKITLIDAAGRTVVFEFDNNAALTGDVAVSIGAANTDSVTNLVNAINNHPTLDISAVDAGSGVINLTQGTVGTAGNTVITETGANISKTDFASGENLAAGTPGNIPVLLGGTGNACATNLFNAINAQTGFRITASNGTPGTVSLVNDVPGTQGNVAIVEGLTNATATGMSGGVNAGVTGGRVAVAIGASKAATATNLRAAINAVASYFISAIENNVPANPVVSLTNEVQTATGNVTVTESTAGARIAVTGMTGGVTPAFGADTPVLLVSAATPGSWGNEVRVRTQATTVMGAPAGRFDLLVEAPVDNEGTLQVVERFKNLSNDENSDRFVELIVNEGVRGEVRASTYITVSAIQPYEPNLGQIVTLGVLTVGADGISDLTTADYIGTSSGAIATGLKAAENAERVDFNVLMIPGMSHKDVVAAMISTAVFRDDCVALIDPPFGLTVTQVIDWHNGDAFEIPNSPTAPLDTNVGIMAWSWGRVFSDYLKKNIWLPPSVGLITVFAFADNNPGPWLAPAGHKRGVLPVFDRVELSPMLADRDQLLGGNNRINPFVEFISPNAQSIVFYGNRTLQRGPGLLDSIHVKRMVIYLKKLVVEAVRFLHFDPNNSQTRRDFEQLVQPLINALVNAGGLEADSTVKCDDENNPPEVRAQRKMVGQLFLRPIDAAESIEIEFAVFSTGVEFTA
jgi:hypothetical protein